MDGSQPTQLDRFEHGGWQRREGAVIAEALVRLHVNGLEIARLMCTPTDLEWLALGFLRGEGLIGRLEDVRLVKVCPAKTCVEVWLRRADVFPAEQVAGSRLAPRAVLTSGCGGGITFADLSATAQPLRSGMRVRAAQLSQLVQALIEAGGLHREVGGVHTAALAGAEGLIAVCEDVGRHNTLDKLWGRCLIEGIPTEDRILLSTGRISSEMLFKAAHMGVPIVASRTSPTSLSIALARAWNVTLVGYVRRESLNVYTGRERILDEEEQSYANA